MQKTADECLYQALQSAKQRVREDTRCARAVADDELRQLFRAHALREAEHARLLEEYRAALPPKGAHA